MFITKIKLELDGHKHGEGTLLTFREDKTKRGHDLITGRERTYDSCNYEDLGGSLLLLVARMVRMVRMSRMVQQHCR